MALASLLAAGSGNAALATLGAPASKAADPHA
jgi:hypothetical protein